MNLLTSLIRRFEINLQQVTASIGLTAHAGGGQANALQLADTFNTVATVATTADSVKIPNVGLGPVYAWVINNGANSLNVFPQTGGNLGAGVNTAVAVAAGKRTLFYSTQTNVWLVVGVFGS